MLSSAVVQDTRDLCASGFSAVCVGKSIVSNRCFFIDLLVINNPPTTTTTAQQAEVQNNATATIQTTTTSATSSSSLPPPPPPVAKRIHMVGDQVMSSAPRTIESILSDHGATIEALSQDLINRYMLAMGNDDHDDLVKAIRLFEKVRNEKLSAEEESSSSSARTSKPLVTMRLFSLCFAAGGRGTTTDSSEGKAIVDTTQTSSGGAHQLSTPEFIQQVSSLFYSPEEVAECLSQASTVTGETAESRLLRRRPVPRVGDIVRIPPNAVALMPKDDNPQTPTSTIFSTTPSPPVVGEKRDREIDAQLPDTNNINGITKVSDFKIATVLGLVVVPQLRVVSPTISFHTRAEPPRPADFADRWLVVRRVGEQLQRWKLPSEQLLPKGATTVNPDKKNNTKKDALTKKSNSHKSTTDNADLGEVGRQGHAGRFKSFAEWIQATFLPTSPTTLTIEAPTTVIRDEETTTATTAATKPLQIADVAGGSGKLSAELSMYGHSCCIVDPRILSFEHIVSLQTQMRQRWLFRAHTKRHMDSRIPKHAANTLATANQEGSAKVVVAVVGGEDDDDDGVVVNKVPKKKPTEEEQFLSHNIPMPTPIRTLHCLCEFPRPGSGRTTESSAELQPKHDSISNNAGGDDGGLDAVLRGCDLVVGLHCDGAVNGILYAATVYKKPFAIVPCCVFPSDFPRCLPPPPLSSSSSFPPTSTTQEGPLSSIASPPLPLSSSVIPVISRDELLDWIEAEARIIQYPGVVRRVVIPGLSGANVCVYGVPTDVVH